MNPLDLLNKVTTFVEEAKSGIATAADRAADVLDMISRNLRDLSNALKNAGPNDDETYDKCCEKLAELTAVSSSQVGAINWVLLAQAIIQLIQLLKK